MYMLLSQFIFGLNNNFSTKLFLFPIILDDYHKESETIRKEKKHENTTGLEIFKLNLKQNGACFKPFL